MSRCDYCGDYLARAERAEQARDVAEAYSVRLRAERDLFKRQLDKVDEVLDWQNMQSDEAHAFTVGRIFRVEQLLAAEAENVRLRAELSTMAGKLNGARLGREGIERDVNDTLERAKRAEARAETLRAERETLGAEFERLARKVHQAILHYRHRSTFEDCDSMWCEEARAALSSFPRQEEHCEHDISEARYARCRKCATLFMDDYRAVFPRQPTDGLREAAQAVVDSWQTQIIGPDTLVKTPSKLAIALAGALLLAPAFPERTEPVIPDRGDPRGPGVDSI